MGVTMNIPLSKPDTGDREIEQVVEVLRSNRLSLGPKLAEFEKKFGAYVGTPYAIATNSGTSALHLAVRALGIGPGDEVITTPFSFVASANCILYQGACPIFVDIDRETLNLDPRQVRRFLVECCVMDTARKVVRNKKTGGIVKAVLPVHVFGLPCQMDAITAIAREFGLHVLEDACEALGAEIGGRKAGTFGDAAVFAFYPNKQMTTGEGGMIVTHNQGIAKMCRSLRNQGRDDDSSWLRHVHLGFNYRLSELHCAVGLAQLERLNEFLRARERVADAYNRALSRNPYLSLPGPSDGVMRSWFVYIVQLILPNPGLLRDRIILKLRERGIESQAYFPAIHKQPYIADTAVAPLGSLKWTEAASERCLALPFFPSMKSEEINYVSETLEELLDAELRSQTGGIASAAFTAAPEVPA
jgi:perosamine synthetase